MKKNYEPLKLTPLTVEFTTSVLAGSKTEDAIKTESSVTIDSMQESTEEFLNIEFKI